MYFPTIMLVIWEMGVDDKICTSIIILPRHKDDMIGSIDIRDHGGCSSIINHDLLRHIRMSSRLGGFTDQQISRQEQRIIREGKGNSSITKENTRILLKAITSGGNAMIRNIISGLKNLLSQQEGNCYGRSINVEKSRRWNWKPASLTTMKPMTLKTLS